MFRSRTRWGCDRRADLALRVFISLNAEAPIPDAAEVSYLDGVGILRAKVGAAIPTDITRMSAEFLLVVLRVDGAAAR